MNWFVQDIWLLHIALLVQSRFAKTRFVETRFADNNRTPFNYILSPNFLLL